MVRSQIYHPQELRNLAEVARYWKQCLERKDLDDQVVASHMVGVVSNKRDELWSQNPAYSLIFEMAASLETPLAGNPRQRQMRWDCIRALIPVLEKHSSQ